MESRQVAPLAGLALMMAIGPIFTTIAFAEPTSIPSSMEVAVSYGDTERTNNCTSCVPSPWCGSPGVQFIGASTTYNGDPTDAKNCSGGDWDTGAILVTNAGSASVTLTGLTVALPLPLSGDPGSPTCKAEARPITFDIWFGHQYYYGNKSDPAYEGGPVTIPAGGQAIFAGTTSDGTYKCPSGNYPSGPTDGTYDFDTSDAYFLEGCVPSTDSASTPRIMFSAMGYAPTTYIDKGHVIDTGGIDTGNCDPISTDLQWPNEALGWRPVGSACGESCPTNQIPVPTLMSSSSSSLSVSSTGQSASSSTLFEVGAVVVLVVVGTLAAFMKRRTRRIGS